VTQKLVQVGETVGARHAADLRGVPRCAAGDRRDSAEHPRAGSCAEEGAVYFDGRRIESTAITFFPSAAPQTNTFRARIDLPQDLQGLAPGMFRQGRFVTGESRRLLVHGPR